MPAPTHVFDPPFNIIRCSHAVLDVTDLDKSAAFYEKTVGLHIEDRDDKSVYLRASEEHQHHSVVLRKAAGDYTPHTLVFFLRDLAEALHSYYNLHRFLVEDDAELQTARLALVSATGQVLRNGLGILGVSAPEKM